MPAGISLSAADGAEVPEVSEITDLARKAFPLGARACCAAARFALRSAKTRPPAAASRSLRARFAVALARFARAEGSLAVARQRAATERRRSAAALAPPLLSAAAAGRRERLVAAALALACAKRPRRASAEVAAFILPPLQRRLSDKVPAAAARARAAASSAATGTRTRCARVSALLARTRKISARARELLKRLRTYSLRCPMAAMTAGSMEVLPASYRDVATCSECVEALRMQLCTISAPAESPCSSNLFLCALATSRPSGRAGAASLSVETRRRSAALPFLVNLKARQAMRRSSRRPRGPIRGRNPPKCPVLPPSRTRRVAHHPAPRASLCERALHIYRECLPGRTRLLCARPARKLSPRT